MRMNTLYFLLFKVGSPLFADGGDNPLSPLPSSTEMTTSYEGAFVRMLLSLVGLLVLLFGTFWVLRRLGKGNFKMGSSRSIQILEKRPLSQKSILYLIEVEGKKILVSESQLEVTTLIPNVDQEPDSS